MRQNRQRSLLIVRSDPSDGTSQFLNGTHKFSDLVLTRLALLMDQKPLSSPAPVGKSAGILRVVTGKMYARALTLSIYTDQKRFFSDGQMRQMEATLYIKQQKEGELWTDLQANKEITTCFSYNW